MIRRPLATAVCALVAGLALPAGAQADPGPYVALGDSFTAGPLVPNQVGEPAGCARSDHNYPSIVAAATGVSVFRDRSCSSATTVHMRSPQAVTLGSNPPQFGGLSGDTALVTIGIGGNDVGLVGAAVSCLEMGTLAPTGTACRSHFAKPGGGDMLVDKIAATAPKIAATLQAIHLASPQARVLLVGYPAVAPRDGTSCYPLVPLSDDDMAYLEGMLRRTNAMLAEQAAANDAEFVDTYEESTGHDVCKPIGTRWFEGLVPMSLAFPVHPNALGEASMARSVLRVLGTPRPGPKLGALTRSKKVIAAGRGLRVSFTLNRAASVKVVLQRSLGRGHYTRARTVGTVAAGIGDNAVTLTAKRIGSRPGLYRVTAALADGTLSRTQFRIRLTARRQLR
ncbi:MAG TPA: SGNH/GDSL hydrolase family protein [Solirubrobacteraceae bacterium]|nr:SGNH/GDSL hydrolase family protein [Solirubrobacteraceae bacterium]